MSSNTNKVAKFFDPHPGIAGAAIPIPEPVRLVANKLNGKTMTLRKAVEIIKSATDGDVRVVKEYSYIALLIRRGNIEHMFRVIRFNLKK